MSTVYTIGHSSHSFEEFLRLLTANQIEVVVDTRSAPYSKFAPQFDRDSVQRDLTQAGVKYLFLGAELGGRPKNSAYYDERGRVIYSRMTKDDAFRAAIERLERGMATFRVVLMCGEEDPAHCHRRLLVSRVLVERGHEVRHVRGDARVESDEQVATASGKPLVNEQPALFAELDEDQWRSTASVSPRKTPASFSAH